MSHHWRIGTIRYLLEMRCLSKQLKPRRAKTLPRHVSALRAYSPISLTFFCVIKLTIIYCPRPLQGAIGSSFATMTRFRLSRASRPLFAGSKAYIGQNTIPPWPCLRSYIIQSQEEELARLPDIDPQKLSITKTTTPKTIVPPEELIFGRNFTGKLSSSHSSRVTRHSI